MPDWFKRYLFCFIFIYSLLFVLISLSESLDHKLLELNELKAYENTLVDFLEKNNTGNFTLYHLVSDLSSNLTKLNLQVVNNNTTHYLVPDINFYNFMKKFYVNGLVN